MENKLKFNMVVFDLSKYSSKTKNYVLKIVMFELFTKCFKCFDNMKNAYPNVYNKYKSEDLKFCLRDKADAPMRRRWRPRRADSRLSPIYID